MCFTGNAEAYFDYDICKYIIYYNWPKFVKEW